MKIIKSIKKILSSEEGFALPAALVLLLVGGLLVVPSSVLVSTSLTANRAVDETDKSVYAADAGIEYALWQVQNNPSLQLPSVGQQSSLPFSETLNGKNLTITISNQDGTTFTIISTTEGGVGRNATVSSDVDLTFSGGSSSAVFDYALASLGGDITLSGNTDVEADEVEQGNIYSNANVGLSGNAKVNGDASAYGTITTINNSRIMGQEYPGYPQLTPPTVDTASRESETLAGTCVPVTHTSWTISGTGNYQHTSPVHVSGNLSISRLGTVTFEQAVCVDGNLSISSLSTVIFQGGVKVGGSIYISTNNSITFGSTVHVTGNFQTTGNSAINLGGTVYIKGAISMSGNSASFNGGSWVIAEGNITLTGNSQLAAEQIPVIMSTSGTATLAGNNWTSAIIYAPNGAITLSGNSRLYGSAVGESISGSGNSKIIYPVDLRNRQGLPGESSGGTTVSSVAIRTYSIH
jgi:hypothetical protein